ncbi:RidA family protein [Ectopseudomonas mendocina]|uniref:RidA family protein n=1 Tax=Ectopseudomonas mendocina TaxID=300 RepID=A0ABZ2RI48_ECTME
MRTIINPASMHSTHEFGFSHAALSSSGNLLHIAGQVAWDKDQNLVGKGDMKAQIGQVLKNINELLATQNATAANIVRLRTFMVDTSPENLEHLFTELNAFYGQNEPAPNTLIGITSLAASDFLIEIEATACV